MARPPAPAPLEALLDVDGVADLLGISRRKVQQLAATGALIHVRVGRLYRFAPDDVRTYIQTNRRRGTN